MRVHPVIKIRANDDENNYWGSQRKHQEGDNIVNGS